LTSVYLITLPVAVFFLLFSADIVKVVYQRGEFTAFSAQRTAPALCLYSLGMVGFSFQEILNKFNYANHNSNTPMKAALLSIVLNVALSAFFAFAFKNAALGALSSAISVTAAAGWLLGSARKSLGRDAFSGFWNTLLKGLVCAAAAGAVMKLLHDVFSVANIARFCSFLPAAFCFASAPPFSPQGFIF
jgi:putative peptidoglycan lipid II flippase